MTSTPLAVKSLDARYGRSQILFGVSFETGSEGMAILGRNGMGKTTLLRAIANLGPDAHGEVWLGQEDIQGRAPHQIAAAGVVMVQAERDVFRDLTTDQNLIVADRSRKTSRAWPLERIYDLFEPLARRRKSRAWQLSGGEQQMLAIGRALAAGPSVLVLDEPAEGLAPVIVHDLVDALNEIRSDGVTLIVAEQSTGFCADTVGRAIVLENGRVQHRGKISDLLADDAVIGTLTVAAARME